MNLVKEQKLFFGCKIDSKMRDALANAKPGDRHYFEDPNSEFLRICEVGEHKWIGKIAKGGSGVKEVEDISRNVLSILRRIAPDIRLTNGSVKIFAAVEESAKPAEPAPAPARDGGPYIEY